MGRSGKDPVRYSDFFEARPYTPRVIRVGPNPEFTPPPQIKPPNGHTCHKPDAVPKGQNVVFDYWFTFDME